MTALLTALVLAPQSSSFFPLEGGHTWEYLVSVPGSAVRVRQMQKTLPVQAYGGAQATPLEVYLDGRIDTTAYYRVIDGFVCLVGVSGTTQMPEPVKVLPANPSKGQKWAFEGQQIVLGMSVPSKVDSRISSEGDMDLFGKKVRTITIETKSQVGTGETGFQFSTTEVYGHGVGLITKRQETTPGKSKQKTITLTTLVRHEKGSGA